MFGFASGKLLAIALALAGVLWVGYNTTKTVYTRGYDAGYLKAKDDSAEVLRSMRVGHDLKVVELQSSVDAALSNSKALEATLSERIAALLRRPTMRPAAPVVGPAASAVVDAPTEAYSPEDDPLDQPITAEYTARLAQIHQAAAESLVTSSALSASGVQP